MLWLFFLFFILGYGRTQDLYNLVMVIGHILSWNPTLKWVKQTEQRIRNGHEGMGEETLQFC